MGENKKERLSPPALGGSSLLVVFAVLCLTVFALLSLSTVRADTRLADASAQAVEAYYAADCQAQEILARLRAGEVPPEVNPDWFSALAGETYTYAVPISDTQELEVEVRFDSADGSWTVLRWQAVPVGGWEETGVEIWDGEMF